MANLPRAAGIRALARVVTVLRHARGAGGRPGTAGSRAGPGAALEALIWANHDASSRHRVPRRSAVLRWESDTNVTQRRLRGVLAALRCS